MRSTIFCECLHFTEEHNLVDSPPMTSTPNDVLTSLRDAANKENTQPLQADRIKAMLVHADYVLVTSCLRRVLFQTLMSRALN